MSAKGTTERLNELAALGLATQVFTNRPGSHAVVREAELVPGLIYDFVDPTTETVGQCWLRADSAPERREWGQDPRGVSPVVLRWTQSRSERYLKPEPERQDEWLVLCLTHGIRDEAIWWGPERSGYYTSLEAAGRYSEEEAKSIQRTARDGLEGDVAVPLSALEKRRTVVLMEDVPGAWEALRKYRERVEARS